MGNLSVFQFQEKQVRTLNIEGEPWFVAKDICEILEISNSRDALSRLDDDEKGVALTDTLGGKQELATVSESGMYALVLSSRKPEAKPFRKWVTSEVLPSIRKTGSYQVTPQQPALPPADVRVANLNAALTAVGFDLANPRFNQGLKDIYGDILGISSQPSLPGGDRWLGVAERAEQLGYPVALVTHYRSQLGKFVKSQGLPSRSENRLCNGTQRLVNLYPVSEELDRAIHAYLASKVN